MQNSNSNPPKKETWLSIRAPGCVIFLFSTLGAYFFIVRPLQDMLNQKEYVSYSNEGVVISILGIIFGLFYAVVGPKLLARMVGSPNKIVSRFWTILLIVVFLLILAFAVATWSALVHQLGYG